jgi:hypothetical protein
MPHKELFRMIASPVAFPAPITEKGVAYQTAYQAALAGQIAPAPERPVRAAAGSIGALIVSYKQSAAYIGLRELTRRINIVPRL